MSRRNKLEKFVELLNLENVYENPDFHNPSLIGVNGENFDLKGKWSSDHFKNSNPIVLELACGRGEYSLALAEMYPHKNFIGVDIKGARIHKGAKKALKHNLHNVAFLRSKIELIDLFFNEREIDEIWITFPDPFLKESKSNKRLTASNFLNKYKNILKQGGSLNLKTDDDKLYKFTLDEIAKTKNLILYYTNENIYKDQDLSEDLKIKTHYEIQHLADERTIKYIKFGFKAD